MRRVTIRRAMTLNLFISWRYLVTKRKEKFISLISVISVLGVAIGVMALIVVIGVMTGFDRDLREKIVGNYAHISVNALRPLEHGEYEEIAGNVRAHTRVRAVSPFIQAQVLLRANDRFMALGFRGIEPEAERKVTRIKDYLIRGSLEQLAEGTVFIGKELAAHFGLIQGSSLTVYSPFGEEFTLTVSGIFQSGMYDYDLNLLIVNLATAQKVLKMGRQISGLAVSLDDMFAADIVKKEIIRSIGFEYSVKTWMEANATFFAALKLEKLAMFIILTLIILVASFNIVSTLVVLVVEKTKDIGILKALGMNSRAIRRLFTLQGLIIGSVGTLAGAAAGMLVCFLLEKYQFIKLPQDIYYIDRLPVAIAFWPDICLIVLSALAITLAATLYPAHKAAALEPVAALRYE